MQGRLLSYPFWLVLNIVITIGTAFALEDYLRFIPFAPLMVFVAVPYLILVAASLFVAMVSLAYGLGDFFSEAMILPALGSVVLGATGQLIREASALPEKLRPLWSYLARDAGFLLWAATIAFLCATLIRAVPILTALNWALQYGAVAWTLSRVYPRGERPAMPVASFVLLLGTLLFCVGFLEFAARILVRTHPGTSAYYMPDRDYLYRLVPGFEGPVEFWPEDPDKAVTMQVRISDLGIRDRDYAAKEANEYRILLLGDSYTFGWGLEIDDSLERVIERDLEARYPNRKITVVNGGTGGYGPWQTHGTLRRVGEIIDPDLVIMQTNTANDISDTLRKENKFLKSFVAPMEKTMQRYRYHFLWQVQADQWLRNHSRIYFIACRAAGDEPLFVNLYNQIRLLAPVSIARVPQPDARPWNYEPDLKIWYPELTHGWEVMQEDLLAIRADSEALGSEFAVYNMPNPFDIALGEERIADYPGKYTLDKNTAIVETFGHETGTSFISVLPAFRAHPDPAGLYYHNDGHLNPMGAEILAGVLADLIVENYLTTNE